MGHVAIASLRPPRRKVIMTTTATTNRYARDWNGYSQHWDRSYGSRYAHLGDEWNDDGTAERSRDELYFAVYAKRWLRPDMTVLEVGPGGGKWTVRIAPLVKKVIVADVAGEMLRRTRERCESLGIHNVEYVQTDGQGFAPVADQSIDLFFSYDVFVHIALEDTFPYASEIARVLKPGAVSVCHYAVGNRADSFGRIEMHNEWYRNQANTLGQYYYYSPEMLTRMYEHVGLRVFELHQEWCYCTILATRTADSVVPTLEQALRAALSSPPDSAERVGAAAVVEALVDELRARLASPLRRLTSAPSGEPTASAVQEIRRIWRGL
jgi:ubiquinone/menaquinone biosynthesis C-methylase UbiE